VFVFVFVLVRLTADRRCSRTSQADGATEALELDFGFAVAERIGHPATAADFANGFGGEIALKVAVICANPESGAGVFWHDQGDVTVVRHEPILTAR